MRDSDVIEQAARVLSRAWGNMSTNESLGFQRMLAGALADAGLLARPLPDRDEIARAVFIESDHRNAAVMAQAWDAPGDGGRQRWWGYADAVLALLKGTKE